MKKKQYGIPQIRALGSVGDLTKTFAEGGWAAFRKPRDKSSQECNNCGFDKLS